jgi:peptide/nickel transport system substrate-binding protein
MENTFVDRNVLRKRLFGVSALLALLLALAACGVPSAAPTAPDAPAESSTGGEEAEAEPTEAAEEEGAEEGDSSEVVESSQAAQASAAMGVDVTSDEDVTTLRTNYGGEYRDQATSDAVNFHPYLTTDTPSSGYQGMVYSGGLLRLDENTLEYIPNMAERYTISDDGLTFTFYLRQGMLWSDGEEVTAHDFKYAYDMASNPDNAFPYLSQLEFIQTYEAVDDYTLQMTIEEIYAPALGQISGLITPLPQHVWENLDWDDPETNPEINSPSVVNGPYKLVEWERDQFVIFEANENYWYKGRPNFDTYIIEIVGDTDIEYQRMLSGEADTGTILPENLEEAKAQPNLNVYEWWPAASSWSFIGFNMRREGAPTMDINVRHGINYAINKEELTDEIMLGQAKRLCSIYPDTSWVYNPDVPCYEYDTEMAIAKFEEAGYTFENGQMLNADGEQLTLNLVYGPNTNTIRELIAVTVQDYLSEIGIVVEIQSMEWASYLETVTGPDDAPEWDMYILGWNSTIEPHTQFSIWRQENIPSLNASGYINEEMEATFEEAGATYDSEIRKEKYGEIQRMIAEDSPYIFLYYSKARSGQNVRIQGIEPRPLGIGWNSEDWYIAEP